MIVTRQENVSVMSTLRNEQPHIVFPLQVPNSNDPRDQFRCRSNQAAKLGLYLLREIRPKPEMLCKFYPVVSRWVCARNASCSMLASNILLQMCADPNEWYSERLRVKFGADPNADDAAGQKPAGANADDAAVASGDVCLVPWYFSNSNLQQELSNCLEAQLQRESEEMKNKATRCEALMQNQVILFLTRVVHRFRSFQTSRMLPGPHCSVTAAFCTSHSCVRIKITQMSVS